MRENSNTYVIKDGNNHYVRLFKSIALEEVENEGQSIMVMETVMTRFQKKAIKFYSSDGPVLADVLTMNTLGGVEYRAVKLIPKKA